MIADMRAYSLDLRERIVAARKQGHPEKQVAQRFGVSVSTVTRYTRLDRQQEPLQAKKAPGKTPLLLPQQEPGFRELLATRADWTLETLRHAWHAQSGILLSKSTLHEHLARLKITYKKRPSKPKNDPLQSAPSF